MNSEDINPPPPWQKNIFVAYILWLFLGVFGAHNFYTKRRNIAFAQLILFFTIIFVPINVVWWIVDIFLIPGRVRQPPPGADKAFPISKPVVAAGIIGALVVGITIPIAIGGSDDGDTEMNAVNTPDEATVIIDTVPDTPPAPPEIETAPQANVPDMVIAPPDTEITAPQNVISATTLKLGEGANVNDNLYVSITDVTLARRYFPAGGSRTDFEIADSGRLFLIADVLVENVGSHSDDVQITDFSGETQNGNAFDAELYWGDTRLIFGFLLPSQRLRSRMVFDIPQGTANFTIYYTSKRLLGLTNDDPALFSWPLSVEATTNVMVFRPPDIEVEGPYNEITPPEFVPEPLHLSLGEGASSDNLCDAERVGSISCDDLQSVSVTVTDVSLTDLYSRQRFDGLELERATSGRSFVIADVLFENTGLNYDEQLELWLQDQDGFVYHGEIISWGGDELSIGIVSPQQQVRSRMLFDIPSNNVTNFIIYYNFAGFYSIPVLGSWAFRIESSNIEVIEPNMGDPPDTVPAPTEIAPERSTLKLGERAASDNLYVTVTDVSVVRRYLWEGSSDLYQRAAPDRRFVLVDVIIENIGSSTEFVSQTDMHGEDQDRFVYDTEFYWGKDDLFFKSILPNQRIRGTVLFDVPASTTSFTIHYELGELFGDSNIASWLLF